MKRNMKRVLALAGAGLLLAVSGCTQSYGMGAAMPGGDTDTRDYEVGHAYRMGPGMMWGDGQGMDGRGMGWHGMGRGGIGMMGGGYGLDMPDLTDGQRAKIADIQKEFRRKQWALMGQMHEQMSDQGWHSGRGMHGSAFDGPAERKAYDTMAALRKQMFENSLEARQRIDSVLTPQQREQWRSRLERDDD